MRRKDGKIEPGIIVFCVVVVWLLLALLVQASESESRPVSWNTSVASVYDGVGLGGVTACHGYKPPSWYGTGR